MKKPIRVTPRERIQSLTFALAARENEVRQAVRNECDARDAQRAAVNRAEMTESCLSIERQASARLESRCERLESEVEWLRSVVQGQR